MLYEGQIEMKKQLHCNVVTEGEHRGLCRKPTQTRSEGMAEKAAWGGDTERGEGESTRQTAEGARAGGESISGRRNSE